MMNASLVQRTSVRDEALAILSRLGVHGERVRARGNCGYIADHRANS